MKTSVFLCALAFGVFAGCATSSTDAPDRAGTATAHAGPLPLVLTGPVSDRFGDYWYQGKAEITSYALQQARYGEVHDGHAVLIFVTEDVSRSKHVKLDHPSRAGDDAVKVMKLNFTKKFNTGIYPYSMMSSVFTPVYRADDPHTLKITTSSQEWCGHTFTQLNRTAQGYHARLYSYFEQEGDRTLDIENAIPEDELWVAIRLNPGDLPTGAVRLIPGTMHQRLSHGDWGVYTATASLKEDPQNPNYMVYSVTYPEQERTLSITFNKAFPHEIEAWEDTYRSGFGRNVRKLTTRATRMKRMMIDYWTRNKTTDEGLRRELALE